MVGIVEDGIRQPVGTQELPDIFDQVQFESTGRQDPTPDDVTGR